ncbi:hypothetical protein LTR53_009859 [Teratosphaeriaceae sp. CCFEE 6253]|nr:hypothetical protein LTR53_009859 [Teratosphaeriaceae sp. CCFEE 6253]
MAQSLCYGLFAAFGMFVAPDKAPATLRRILIGSDRRLTAAPSAAPTSDSSDHIFGNHAVTTSLASLRSPTDLAGLWPSPLDVTRASSMGVVCRATETITVSAGGWETPTGHTAYATRSRSFRHDLHRPISTSTTSGRGSGSFRQISSGTADWLGDGSRLDIIALALAIMLATMVIVFRYLIAPRIPDAKESWLLRRARYASANATEKALRKEGLLRSQERDSKAMRMRLTRERDQARRQAENARSSATQMRIQAEEDSASALGLLTKQRDEALKDCEQARNAHQEASNQRLEVESSVAQERQSVSRLWEKFTKFVEDSDGASAILRDARDNFLAERDQARDHYQTEKDLTASLLATTTELQDTVDEKTREAKVANETASSSEQRLEEAIQKLADYQKSQDEVDKVGAVTVGDLQRAKKDLQSTCDDQLHKITELQEYIKSISSTPTPMPTPTPTELEAVAVSVASAKDLKAAREQIDQYRNAQDSVTNSLRAFEANKHFLRTGAQPPSTDALHRKTYSPADIAKQYITSETKFLVAECTLHAVRTTFLPNLEEYHRLKPAATATKQESSIWVQERANLADVGLYDNAATTRAKIKRPVKKFGKQMDYLLAAANYDAKQLIAGDVPAPAPKVAKRKMDAQPAPAANLVSSTGTLPIKAMLSQSSPPDASGVAEPLSMAMPAPVIPLPPSDHHGPATALPSAPGTLGGIEFTPAVIATAATSSMQAGSGDVAMGMASASGIFGVNGAWQDVAAAAAIAPAPSSDLDVVMRTAPALATSGNAWALPVATAFAASPALPSGDGDVAMSMGPAASISGHGPAAEMVSARLPVSSKSATSGPMDVDGEESELSDYLSDPSDLMDTTGSSGQPGAASSRMSTTQNAVRRPRDRNTPLRINKDRKRIDPRQLNASGLPMGMADSPRKPVACKNPNIACGHLQHPGLKTCNKCGFVKP